MDSKSLEQRLQSELDELVSGSDDVFSAVLGVSRTNRDFEWAGASGMAYPDQPEADAGRYADLHRQHHQDVHRRSDDDPGREGFAFSE